MPVQPDDARGNREGQRLRLCECTPRRNVDPGYEHFFDLPVRRERGLVPSLQKLNDLEVPWTNP
jgi:hypothetical protein